jgi:small subunit ribosomal protein S4
LGYGIQLREKQKLKRYYGMSEKQFRLFFKRAERKKGITGENLLSLLERRLDNVLFLTGFAYSRMHARQLITHGHFRINRIQANVPSMLVNPEDVISFREKSSQDEELIALVEASRNKEVPSWLEKDSENMQIRVVSQPTREDIPIPVEEHLIVELYSK